MLQRILGRQNLWNPLGEREKTGWDLWTFVAPKYGTAFKC